MGTATAAATRASRVTASCGEVSQRWRKCLCGYLRLFRASVEGGRRHRHAGARAHHAYTTAWTLQARALLTYHRPKSEHASSLALFRPLSSSESQRASFHRAGSLKPPAGAMSGPADPEPGIDEAEMERRERVSQIPVAIIQNANESPSATMNRSTTNASRLRSTTTLFTRTSELVTMPADCTNPDNIQIDRALVSFRSLPAHHQALVPSFMDKIARLQECTRANAAFIATITADLENFGPYFV